MIWYGCGPSTMKSSTPVTVTVCAAFQFAGVNVRLDTDATPSAALLEDRPMVTLAVGWLVSRTEKVAAPPASVVTRPAVGVTVIPATSLSRFVRETSAAFTPL